MKMKNAEDLKQFLLHLKTLKKTSIDIDQVIRIIEGFESVIVPNVMLCECNGNERIALDCTMKPCKHPKYFKG